MSWPPKTRDGSGGSAAAAKGAVSLTMPVAGWSPAVTAAHPATAVVATEPRAPMSHTPVRGGDWLSDAGAGADGFVTAASLVRVVGGGGRGHGVSPPASSLVGRRQDPPYEEGSSLIWTFRKDTLSSAPWFCRPM